MSAQSNYITFYIQSIGFFSVSSNTFYWLVAYHPPEVKYLSPNTVLKFQKFRFGRHFIYMIQFCKTVWLYSQELTNIYSMRNCKIIWSVITCIIKLNKLFDWRVLFRNSSSLVLLMMYKQYNQCTSLSPFRRDWISLALNIFLCTLSNLQFMSVPFICSDSKYSIFCSKGRNFCTFCIHFDLEDMNIHKNSIISWWEFSVPAPRVWEEGLKTLRKQERLIPNIKCKYWLESSCSYGLETLLVPSFPI